MATTEGNKLQMPLKPKPVEPVLKIPAVVRRNTLIFAASQALVGTGMMLIPSLGAIMVLQLLGNAALAGLAMSTLGITRFVVSYPTGKISDTYGRKVTLVVGLSVSLVGSLVIGSAMIMTSFLLFILGLLIFGLGAGAVQQLRVAAADMYPPSRRAEGLGYVLTGSVVGAVGGTGLVSFANFMSSRTGIDPIALAWIFVPLVIVPGMFLIMQVKPDPKEIAANLEKYYPGYMSRKETAAGAAEDVGFLAFIKHYPKLAAFVASFAVQGVMAMMMVMTALALNRQGYTLPALSFSATLHAIGMFGFSLPLGKLTDRFGRRAIIIAGLLTCAAGALLVPTTSLYWTITAGTFLVGLGWSCVNVASTALIADTTSPLARGRAIGANDTFSAASAIGLPLLAGFFVEGVGLQLLGLVALLLILPPLVLMIRLRESEIRRPSQAAIPAR
ncbi:MAG: MFS transporter [Dehalococcoidia bacterium]|nr:MFS transporter [Dehalococcoidia bacterium]